MTGDPLRAMLLPRPLPFPPVGALQPMNPRAWSLAVTAASCGVAGLIGAGFTDTGRYETTKGGRSRVVGRERGLLESCCCCFDALRSVDATAEALPAAHRAQPVVNLDGTGPAGLAR